MKHNAKVKTVYVDKQHEAQYSFWKILIVAAKYGDVGALATIKVLFGSGAVYRKTESLIEFVKT